MPYRTLAELPDGVKVLPKHAQEIYMAAFNSAFKQYEGDEAKSHGTAWAAVKTKYKKNPAGNWVAKEAKVEVKEAMSDNDKRELLQTAVINSLAIGNRDHGPWIRDVYDKELVYEIGGKNYLMSYVIDRKGKVVLGQAELVTPMTVYTPVKESVEAKIDEIVEAASAREEKYNSSGITDKLLELLEVEELTEATAAPVLVEADVLIAKLSEAAPAKTEDGVAFPKAAYAYAPDPEKSTTWKLRLWEDLEKKVTRVQLGRAAAALSPGGFRGQKVAIPSADLPAVKRKIRAEYRKLGVEDEEIPRWVKEADEARQRIFESCDIDIAEVTKDGIAKGVVPVRIIKPGFNTSKERFYSDQAVKDAAVIFEGAKMYSDHPTKEDEKQRPERSIRDWVATLHNTKVSSEGNAVGESHINAGWLKEKIQTLFEQGDLQHLGTSINAIGNGTKQTIEGIKTVLVERLVKSSTQSVDFVTEAGAGGQAGLRESASDSIVDAELMDIATLREARPDLIEAIESNIREQIQTEVKAKMEAEDTIKELEEQVETLTTENASLKEEKAQAEKAKEKAEAQATIKDAVDKAELPDAAKTRLIEAHKDDDSAEGIDEVIKSEVKYIADLTESGKIKDLGPPGPVDEKVKEELEEGFGALGMSKEAAKEAAKGR